MITGVYATTNYFSIQDSNVSIKDSDVTVDNSTVIIGNNVTIVTSSPETDINTKELTPTLTPEPTTIQEQNEITVTYTEINNEKQNNDTTLTVKLCINCTYGNKLVISYSSVLCDVLVNPKVLPTGVLDVSGSYQPKESNVLSISSGEYKEITLTYQFQTLRPHQDAVSGYKQYDSFELRYENNPDYIIWIKM